MDICGGIIKYIIVAGLPLMVREGNENELSDRLSPLGGWM
jgi:hypothetical protein